MADTLYTNYQSPPVYAEALNDFNNLTYHGKSPLFQTSTGTVNNYTLTIPVSTTYTTPSKGDSFTFQINVNNTGASNIYLATPYGTLGPYPITRNGAALTGGELNTGITYLAFFTGSGFDIYTGQAAITNAVLTTGNQSIAGIKTFTTAPVVPDLPALSTTTALASANPVNAQSLLRTGRLVNGLTTVSGNITLTATDMGKAFYFSSGTSTATLPALSTVVLGSLISFVAGTVNGSVTTSASDSIFIGNTTQTTVGLKTGEDVTLLATGTGWYSISRTALPAATGSWTRSLASPGYQVLPSGLILQWGISATPAGGGVIVTLPTAFSATNSYFITVSVNNASSVGYFLSTATNTTTTFVVNAITTAGAGAATSFFWHAIGY